MTLIYINLAIAVLCVTLWWLNTIKASQIFKTRIPELKIPRSHWSDRTLAFIKGFLMCVCPIINLKFAWVMIAKSDELCEKTVAKVYKRCTEEQK